MIVTNVVNSEFNICVFREDFASPDKTKAGLKWSRR